MTSMEIGSYVIVALIAFGFGLSVAKGQGGAYFLGLILLAVMSLIYNR